MVKLFYSESCEYCRRLKDYLDENRIDYILMNVDNSDDNAYELIRLTNQTTLPVIIIGDRLICGFDIEKIKKEIERFY